MLKDKKLYYIGGVVRDEILGVQSYDTDFCYEGDAIYFAENAGLNIIKRNPDFGTVRVISDGKEIDIASTRKETYPQAGHLPEVTDIGCKLEEDLKRRDFTINALAKNTISGELSDYFGGIEDIKNKKLRVLHDNSFIDDPTRIIRALKFSVRFGFDLDEKTKKLQEKYLDNINYDMSYHRVKKELIETFNLNNSEAFDKFITDDIYKLLNVNQNIPEISGKKIQDAINKHKISNPWIVYMGFFDLSKLALTRQEKKIIEWIEKLETQNPADNTPIESIIIHTLKTGGDI